MKTHTHPQALVRLRIPAVCSLESFLFLHNEESSARRADATMLSSMRFDACSQPSLQIRQERRMLASKNAYATDALVLPRMLVCIAHPDRIAATTGRTLPMHTTDAKCRTSPLHLWTTSCVRTESLQPRQEGNHHPHSASACSYKQAHNKCFLSRRADRESRTRCSITHDLKPLGTVA